MVQYRALVQAYCEMDPCTPTSFASAQTRLATQPEQRSCCSRGRELLELRLKIHDLRIISFGNSRISRYRAVFAPQLSFGLTFLALPLSVSQF
jgi:hypothetical protein